MLTDEIGREPKTLDEALDWPSARSRSVNGSVKTPARARAARTRLRLAEQRQLPKARTDFEQSLPFYKSASHGYGDSPRTAATRRTVLFDGSIVQADEEMFRACAMRDGTLGPGHPEMAKCLRLQAITRDKVGDRIGAGILRERGFAIAEPTSEPSIHASASISTILANSLQDLGEFSAARALVCEGAPDGGSPARSRDDGATAARFDQAILDPEIGDFGKHIARCSSQSQHGLRVLHTEPSECGRAMNTLEESYRLQGRDEEALPYFGGHWSSPPRASPTSAIGCGDAVQYGGALEHMGRMHEALERSSEALRSASAFAIEQTCQKRSSFTQRILARLGQVEMAERAHARELEMFTSSLGPTHPSVTESEMALAAVEARLGETAGRSRAVAGAKIARERALLTLGWLPERQALAYARTWPKGLDMAMSFADLRADAKRCSTSHSSGARSRSTRWACGGAPPRRGRPRHRALWDRLGSARQRLADLSCVALRRPAAHATLVDLARREKEAPSARSPSASATFSTNTRRATIGLRKSAPPSSGGGARLVLSLDRTVGRRGQRYARRDSTEDPFCTSRSCSGRRRRPWRAARRRHDGGGSSAWRDELIAGSSGSRWTWRPRAGAARTRRRG